MTENESILNNIKLSLNVNGGTEVSLNGVKLKGVRAVEFKQSIEDMLPKAIITLNCKEVEIETIGKYEIIRGNNDDRENDI